jgi:2-desacetyl-2-hydroxyethyl bacteriochlorophyllide A dehydrogenase
MQAALALDGGRFDVATIADPEPGPGELLLRVTACGLCGSDLKARGAFPAGTVMGHELCGDVVALGPGVDGWDLGTNAAVLPVAFCGTCDWCVAGDVVHCEAAQLIGLGGAAGGFAELIVVPAASSFAVPGSIERVHGALVEPYAVGLHVADAGAIGAGDRVLVVGAGTVGLTTMAWARAHGAATITAVDPVAARREVSGSFGATDELRAIGDATPNGYDVIVECVGKPGLLDGCIAAARPRGRIVVAGVCIDTDPYWPVPAVLKEVSIRFAAYYSPAEFRTVIDAFVSGTIDPAPLVGRTMALASLDEAFAELAASTTTGKILITPR